MTKPSLALADRRSQRAAVIGALHARRMSRTALVERFDVSSSLITRIVRGLIDDGVIHETGTQLPSAGRPAVQLEVTKHYGTLIAVNCTADGIHARSFDLHDNILREIRLDAPEGGMTPQHIIESIASLARLTPRLLGIGVGIAGIVDADTGAVSAAPNLGWTEPVALYDLLYERTGVAVTIDNDVNLMMAAERPALAPELRSDALYLYLGKRGIGAGFISAGRLVRGRHGAAGELGLVSLSSAESLDNEAPTFEERFASTTIAARLRDAGHDVTGPVVPTLFSLAAAGDEAARTIRAELVAGFATAISLATALLDPAVVILGGEARDFTEIECAEIRSLLQRRLPFVPALQPATLTPDAVLDAARDRCWNTVLAGGI